jgi:hypothetical protein
MARKVQAQLIDDISGEEAQETVTFALDGVGFEIDLTESHAAELREALQKFVSNGRRLKRQVGWPWRVGRSRHPRGDLADP